VEEVKLNPAQRNILPYLLAFAGAAIAVVGLITPWLSIGARGVSGSSSGQGKLTYLVIGSLVVLGLIAFVDQLKNHRRLIALVTMAVSFDVLVSYAIWANRAFSAVNDFNNEAEKLDDVGGLFGGALSNIADSIQPSVTTGFYMVCAGAIIGIVSSALIFKQPTQDSFEHAANPGKGSGESQVSISQKKEYFGVSQTPFFITLATAILGLAVIVAGSSSSDLSASLNSNPLNSLDSSSTTADEVSSDAFSCIQLVNTKNVIKLNQSRFSGDPSPTDTFVATQFRIANNCEKAVIGIKGTMVFRNVVGDEIFTGDFNDDQTIKAGESITTRLDYGWTFNEFEDEHGILAGIDQSKAKANLVLSKVAFEDGTSISD